MTSTPKHTSQTLVSDAGSITLSGVELIEATPEGARIARRLIDEAAATGITSMKMRRIGRYSVSVIRGRLTPMAKLADGTLSLGAGPIGVHIQKH